MKRRTLIKGFLAAGVTGAVGYSGFKWYSVKKTPSLEHIEEERALLASLGETIIPETDTPGARSVGVEEFIIRMLRNQMTNRDVNRFLDGLEDVKALAQRTYGKSFQECSQEERERLLSEMEQGGMKNALLLKVQDRYLGRSFIRSLKYLVCSGFAFSKPGATQALRYEAIPGSYKPNIPLKPGETSWLHL